MAIEWARVGSGWRWQLVTQPLLNLVDPHFWPWNASQKLTNTCWPTRQPLYTWPTNWRCYCVAPWGQKKEHSCCQLAFWCLRVNFAWMTKWGPIPLYQDGILLTSQQAGDGDDADRPLCMKQNTQMTGVRSWMAWDALRVRGCFLRVFYQGTRRECWC